MHGATRALLDADARALPAPVAVDALLRRARRVRRHLARGRRGPPDHGFPRQQRAPGRLPPSARDGRGQARSSTRCRSRRADSPTRRPSTSPRKLAALAPDPLGKVLFAPGGTLAIGMALKLARVATGRHKTLSMWDSFHGASLDAISIGGEAVFRKHMGPLLPGTEHAPPCDPARVPLRLRRQLQPALRRISRLRARQGRGRRRGHRRDGPLHRRRRSRRPTITGSCATPATATARC